MQELDISKKPLIKSITALISAVEVYREVTGHLPSRILASKAQFDWYVKTLQDFASKMNWQVKHTRLDEPTFRGIPVYYKND